MRGRAKTRLISILIFILLSSAAHAGAADSLAPKEKADGLWARYKAEYIQHDGRIIDKRQNQISHSEGQAYGMVNSLLFDDRAAFDVIWRWTKDNLQVRKDNLFAWGWGKRHDEQWGVIDYNNATDGDVLIAYSLIRASAKWDNPEYKSEGMRVIESIRKNLSKNHDGRVWLLPAYYGFANDGRPILNPSYVIFPAYRLFAKVDDRAFWEKAHKDGMFLIEKCAFGRLGLPPDWVIADGPGFAIHTEKGARFGYDSVRTILYLSMEKDAALPKGINAMLDLYERLGYLPLFVDLSNDSVSLQPAPAGFYAIYARAAQSSGRTDLSKRLVKEALEKAAVEKNDYYSMSLMLMAIKYSDP